MGDSKIFKCGFDISDYKDILPSYEEYRKNDFCLNMDEYKKGNIDNCVWKKYKPSLSEMMSEQFREIEVRRILKTGVFTCISEEICWIPPQYYFALQYGKTGGDDLEFRLSRLMHVYFKIRARNNPHCKGTFTVKARQCGETTMAISDMFWNTFDAEDSQFAIQSKTRNDAINPCWKTMQTLWMNLPFWLKEDLCPDFTSGTNIAETMKFMRMADERKGVTAKNVLIAYYPAVFNAIDGKNNVKILIYDEILKWIECDFGDAFNNASKFIMPGFQRRGMFDMFSSPPEKMSKSYKDGHALWLKSDPTKLDENGTTESRIHRYYSNPLLGIQGGYDKFGDADPEKIYDWIMRERKRQPKDKLLEEIRGFPLNDEEIWGSVEGADNWDNMEGLRKRQIYLMGTRFKDERTKEPTVLRGNFEWKEGIYDNPDGVDFRQADVDEFDVNVARWALTHIPKNIQALKNIFYPPDYVERSNGADPFGKRHPGKKPSDGAGLIFQFRDILETGFNRMPIGFYLNRPYHEDIYFEDMLKACIYWQAPLQFENNHDRIGGYFTDRGYKAWVIPTIGERAGSDKLGDAITARGKFMNEMIGLIQALINKPVNPEDECGLERIWFRELVDDLIKFNLKDTHENDATMCLGQALMGAVKLMQKKVRKQSALNNGVLDYLLAS